MGYLHINNLYKDQRILLFKQCYALEKIHGTSAHISWNYNAITFSSGGAEHKQFIKLFDERKLSLKLFEMFPDKNITIYGEAYGGKEQGMSKTYGKELKFIVFDIKIDEMWLDVPNAHEISKKLELEFVDYSLIETTIEAIDAERDKPSTQSKRNGISEDKIREGIVLRPLIEVKINNGERIIAKHKNDIYRETKSIRTLTQEQLAILGGAEEIANEWVTPMRLSHVIDKIGAKDITDTGKVIAAMIEDVIRESKNEIIETAEARKAIGKKSAQLYKEKIMQIKKRYTI